MKPFDILVNEKKFQYDAPNISGEGLLILVGLPHSLDYEILFKLNHKEFEPIQLDEIVDLTNPEIETFLIKPLPSTTIEVDDERYPIAQIFMTPKEILVLAGIKADNHYLKQIQEHKEITYKNDMDYTIAIVNKMKFVSCKLSSTTVS
ncbi:MAG TPA: multiubiquitin domain-containing protein [Pedobacter sp.]|uniref:multiubiquitin domain-containing protein n=1 Tax=Pedobacter sp. TaxID=1411316 RepID=UPI002BB99886|nr:multiubiquitin domain-containing protein [Pedobacter sp.]HMI02497.1 multiubiquitin domain-containing protein [Pedobacter sp.]